MTCKELKAFVDKQATYDISLSGRKLDQLYYRWIYYYLCYKYASNGYSFSRIAKEVNKSHATVMHGIKEFHNVYKYDDAFKNLCNAIEDSLIDNNSFPEHVHRVISMDNLNLIKENKKLRLRIKELNSKNKSA